MSLLSLIFDRPIKTEIETIIGTERVVVPMDATPMVSHERGASITKSAIEDGSNIADHVNLEPERLNMEALITDVPVSIIASLTGLGVSSASQLAGSALSGLGAVGASLASQAVGLLAGSLAGLLTGTPRDPKDAFRFLEQLWQKGEPFTVVTSLKRYENMILTSLSVPRRAQDGDAIRFNIGMEQVKITRSAFVTIPSFKVGGNASAQSAVNLGKQAAKETSEETARTSSFLLQGIQKTTGALL
jgi:hypothetical protein